ncbi:MAG TPA: type IV pilus modification protein PilV [Gammaproteobacteria bacterium]|nr:type IV pilus modification protein PilV [Gammaproteobacteria bacterium]
MNTFSSKSRSTGFTLIEVLISLVILSVGLLGIAGMITVSLKSSGSTYTRTQVTALTYNILDRMRANRANSSNYDIAIGSPGTNTDCLGATADCSPADIAKFDVYEWKQMLANELPAGDGSIATKIVNNMTQVTITIQWSDARAQQALGEVSASTTNVPVSSLSITTSL